MSVLLSSTYLFLFLALGFVFAKEPPATLTVAAAADLSALQPDLVASFHQSNPAIQVRFVTASSAVLSQQIENGAPYDVFLSANAQFIERLTASGKIEPTSVLAYAIGRVGVLWRDNKSHDIKELKETWVRFVALPNPKLAPYGVAAQEALEHAGLWEFVRQKVVYGENVRQALQLFESGNADAVLTSDALLQGKPAALIPAEWHKPIVQKGGIVASTPNSTAAREFVRYLTIPAAQAVFAHYGFSKP